MLNDVTLRLYNLYHWEPVPRQSHIIYSHYPLPKSSIVNPIWIYGGRCRKRDFDIWLCTYNFSFWRLTQAIFITKVLWRTNSQLTETKCSMLIPSSDSISMSQNYVTPLRRKQSRWLHWALWLTTLELYVPCLKGSALDSATMPYQVEAKELRYLLWIHNHLYISPFILPMNRTYLTGLKCVGGCFFVLSVSGLRPLWLHYDTLNVPHIFPSLT